MITTTTIQITFKPQQQPQQRLRPREEEAEDVFEDQQNRRPQQRRLRYRLIISKDLTEG
jgi:hypothetical protein